MPDTDNTDNPNNSNNNNNSSNDRQDEHKITQEDVTRILQVLGTFLPIIPARYRAAAAAGLIFISALAAALFGAVVVDNVQSPSGESTYQATGLFLTTRNQTIDTELKIGKSTNTIKSQRYIVQPTDTNTQEVAPLMNWTNDDIKDAVQAIKSNKTPKPMQWCLQEADPTVAADFRNTLDQIYTPRHITWQETCPAPYTFGATANVDCGSDNAVGCASYYSSRSGRISYNGPLFTSGQASLSGIHVAISHEVGHIFNLGHTTCNNPEPSVMSPLYLPDGPACAGGTGYTPQDWTDTDKQYGFQDIPQPTPTNSPTPAPDTQVLIRTWTPRGPTCNQDWCVTESSSLPIPTGGVWVDTIRRTPNGDTQLGTFQYIKPITTSDTPLSAAPLATPPPPPVRSP